MRFMWGEGAKGLWVGALLGGLLGLGVGMSLIEGDLLFTGVTMLIGAVVCGLAGFFYGDSFFEWLKDHWHWW